jgi:hypothetical protein
MLIPELELQMLQFVRRFYVVKVRQINKFFSDWSTGEVKYAFSRLIEKSFLIYHGADNEYVSFARTLPHSLDFYEPCINAIDVMITIRSKQIIWFNRDVFPLEITFSTTDNRIYDVAVFDEFWMAKYSLIKRTRSQHIPAGEEDVVDHIAVVPNDDIGRQVRPLGFSLFAKVDPRTGCVDYFEIVD